MQTPNELAEFFENRHGDRLFGILHRSEAPNDRELAIVFCHPISWEKQFSYRSYSHFSRHLSGAGYTSFRFDAYGFGDSDGELVDATIQSQVNDVLDALDWLRNTAGYKKFVLVGVRLGAAIASLAAESSQDVEGLVLVSPVAHGETYWKEMLRFSRFGRMTLGQKLIKSSDLLATLERQGAVEIDGELFGRRFVEELRAIDLTQRPEGYGGKHLMRELASGGADRSHFEALVGVLKARGANVAAAFDEPKEFWIMKHRYEAYVPTGLYESTVDWLNEAQAQ